ncbi:MAG TPA: hypothetical protein VFD47_05455 [Actinomycetota bacterium]|nr:hypothetical protein [Actinomycetota bacterium]
MTTNTTIQTSVEGAGKARRIAFYVFLVLFALMHILFNLMIGALLGWFAEEGAISHRVHLIVFGWVFVLSFVGLLAHLRRPETKVAQMYQVLIALGFIVATTILVDRLVDPVVISFLILPLLLVALHPNRTGLRRPSTNMSKTLMALALVATIPLSVDAFVQVRIGLDASRVAPQILEDIDESLSDAEFERQFNAAARRATDSAAEAEQVVHYGHWSAMGAFNLILIGLALLAAVRPPGWRLPAWSAGLSAVLFGVASIANPGDASAINAYWSVFAIAWGIGFIAVAETTRQDSAPRTVADPATA